MPNKSKFYSGIYKYNDERKKKKKKKCIIDKKFTGKLNSYIDTFINKFFTLPFYLILNSHKYNCLVLPEEGYAFLKIFSSTKKNILIIHDFRKKFNSNHKIKINEKLKQIYINFNFLFLKKFNKIIVPSNFTKKSIVKYEFISEKKISIIPNIINFDGIKPKYCNQFKILKKLKKNKKIVLCITSNETRKNLNLLNKIINNLSNINFIVVGNIKNKIYSANCFNFKNLKDENLIYLYKNSNVYLDVSLFEGFGRCLIEAQNYKLKVVCLNTENNKEILKNSGALISNKYDLSSINYLINKKIKSSEKKKFYKNFKRFSSKTILKNFKKEIYEI